jgi:aerobic C4-dicarboxylate transport protein
MEASTGTTAAAARKPLYAHLYFQVLTAIILECCSVTSTLSYEQMKPLGDGFIKLIKMLIAPIIFCTVVHGIASMEDMKKVAVSDSKP